MSELTCSVAIATYNGERFIAKQLETIINQTHRVDEIVVCDDASTDGTWNIIQEYSRQHTTIKWKLILNDTNLGYSKNFKQAITASDSDIIFLCDQDDLWAPNKVANILKVFRKNPQILSVVTDFKVIDSCDNFTHPMSTGDNIWAPSRVRRDSEKLYKIHLNEILGHNWAPGCTQAVRKEMLGVYTNIRSNMVHDWLLNIIAAFSGGCYYYREPLTYYRIHGSNTIGMPLGIDINKKDRFWEKCCQFLRAVKYSFLEASGKECRLDLLNLPPETLLMIEEFAECQEACERDELNTYHEFEQGIIQTIYNRRLIEYICLRIKYSDFFKHQNRLGIYSEWASKLMRDICGIVKR